ncbi:MAG: class II glutamine amidotransferase [Gemmatimonadota bacterium]
MIAFASSAPRDVAPFLSALGRFCRSGNLVPGWERRPAGNHPDGWGIAYRRGDAMSVVRSGEPAAADPRLGGIAAKTTRFVGHVRYASNPETVGAGNSHPFLSGGIVVAHNGTFRGSIGREADARGTSDTLVFTEILAGAWRDRTLAGLRDTLSRLLCDAALVGDYSAANMLIAAGASLFALRRFHRNPDYYTLYLHAEAGLAVAASEPLDGFHGWRLLADGELVALSGPAPRSVPLGAE